MQTIAGDERTALREIEMSEDVAIGGAVSCAR